MEAEVTEARQWRSRWSAEVMEPMNVADEDGVDEGQTRGGPVHRCQRWVRGQVAGGAGQDLHRSY